MLVAFITVLISDCATPSLVAVSRDYHPVVEGSLPVTAALPIAGQRPQVRGLSSCGVRASALCGMWDLPGSGMEPMSPELAGGFPTTRPPGKPMRTFFRRMR